MRRGNPAPPPPPPPPSPQGSPGPALGSRRSTAPPQPTAAALPAGVGPGGARWAGLAGRKAPAGGGWVQSRSHSLPPLHRRVQGPRRDLSGRLLQVERSPGRTADSPRPERVRCGAGARLRGRGGPRSRRERRRGRGAGRRLPDGPGAVRARGAGSARRAPGWEPRLEGPAALTVATWAQSQARRAARRRDAPGVSVSPGASLEARRRGWGGRPGLRPTGALRRGRAFANPGCR